MTYCDRCAKEEATHEVENFLPAVRYSICNLCLAYCSANPTFKYLGPVSSTGHTYSASGSGTTNILSTHVNNRYNYPDGSSSNIRPNPGQVSSNSNGNYRWNDSNSLWEFVGGGYGYGYNLNSINSNGAVVNSYEKMKIAPEAIKEKKCECGKDKHGFSTHSTWCDLYEL